MLQKLEKHSENPPNFQRFLSKDCFKKNLEIHILLVLFQKNEKGFLQKINRKLTLVPFVMTWDLHLYFSPCKIIE